MSMKFNKGLKLNDNSPVWFETTQELLVYCKAYVEYIKKHPEKLLSQELEKDFIDEMKEDFQKIQKRNEKYNIILLKENAVKYNSISQFDKEMNSNGKK